MELQEFTGDIESRGVSVIAVLYDSPQDLDRFSRKHKLTLTLASDPDSRAIKALGLLNEEMDPETKYYGVPYPGIFVLNGSNQVVARFAERDYRERPLINDVLDAVASLTD